MHTYWYLLFVICRIVLYTTCYIVHISVYVQWQLYRIPVHWSTTPRWLDWTSGPGQGQNGSRSTTLENTILTKNLENTQSIWKGSSNCQKMWQLGCYLPNRTSTRTPFKKIQCLQARGGIPDILIFHTVIQLQYLIQRSIISIIKTFTLTFS